MKKSIKIISLFLLICILLGFAGCENKQENNVDYCAEKKCYKCGADAETWVYGGVSEAYTPSNRYEKSGGIYKIFYCKKCLNSIPKAESPFLAIVD